MKQAGYWIVRTYEAGIIGEKTKYWVKGDRPSGESRRKEKAEIKKQEQNEYSALKAMARIANENFRKGDLLLGLDYSDGGLRKLIKRVEQKRPEFRKLTGEKQRDLILDAAWHEAELCLRRVAREMKKDGQELRYILVTADMDGETKEPKRVHHHLFIEAGCREVFVRKWEKLGGVNWKEISGQADYLPICEYFLKQVRHIPDAKKFRSSRNLRRPQPRDRVAASDAELRVPSGGKLLMRTEQRRPGGRSYAPQYIRYIIPEDKRRGKREGREGKTGKTDCHGPQCGPRNDGTEERRTSDARPCGRDGGDG